MNIPDEFIKVLEPLIDDIKTTFPEYTSKLNKWWKPNDEKYKKKSIKILFDFCKKKFPPRFFDILYQNEEMFSNAEVDAEFLPNIDFKEIWKSNISDKTKETIWKYLQMISFSVIGTIDSTNSFGDAAKLFEAIPQSELKSKLEETFSNIDNLFTQQEGEQKGEQEGEQEGEKQTPEQLNDHIKSMFKGKIGSLAEEIAEELAKDLEMDSTTTDPNEMLKKLMRNPAKMMDVIKKLGNKLTEKFKSGEIKESEMMAEAAELMNNMKKNMPGMNDLFSKMGMNLGKVNTGAMKTKLQQQAKLAKMKERMRSKL